MTNIFFSKPEISASALLLGSAILLGFAGFMPWLNAALLPVFALGLYGISAHHNRPHGILALLGNITLWLMTMLIGFFIAIFRPEGFEYPLIWQSAGLYDGGKPFSLQLNTSKALGGYLVVLWLWQGSKAKAPRSISLSILATLVAILTVLALAHLVFGVSWQPKLPDGTLYFIAVNLGITVVAEEAFFRLLVQHAIARFFSYSKLGIWLAFAITSVLFALAHTTSLSPAFVMFLIAGMAYAGVYAYTRHLSMAIAVHFGVNILHFLLLSYPL